MERKGASTLLLTNVVPAVVVLLSLVVVAMSMSVLYSGHWHGPFRDMWEIFPFLEKVVNANWTLVDLWQTYGNSHRLFIPKLLYIADYHFSGASNHLLIVVSILCQCLICLAFYWVLNKAFSDNKTLFLTLCFAVLLFQFSGTLLFNFMHTFDVQWFLTCAFVVLAILALQYSWESKSSLLIVLSAVFICLACLCNLSAMAAWPVWLLTIYLQKRSLLAVLPWLVLMSLAVVTLGQGVQGNIHQFLQSEYIQQGGVPAIIVSALDTAFRLPVLYLSNPLCDTDYMPIPYWAPVMTFLLLLHLLWFFYQVIRSKTTSTPAELFFASLALFAYGVAVMTLIGRGYDVKHVYAWRYQNIVVLFWSAMLPWVVLRARLLMNAIQKFWLISVVTIFLAYVYCQPAAWNDHLLLSRNVERGHLALMMGFSDDVPLIAPTVSRSMIYVESYNLEKERALHEKSRMGIYHDTLGRYWLDGVPLKDIENQCQFRADIAIKEKPGHKRLVVDVAPEGRDYRHALLLNESGGVEGIALRPLPKDIGEFWDFSGEHSALPLQGLIRKEAGVGHTLFFMGPKGGCKKLLGS